MNSVKRILVSIFLLFSFCLYAEEIPFSVSGNPGPTAQGAPNLDDPEQQASLIAELKTRAINEWLQGYLGNRFPQFEKQITPDFAEKYISDYKVARLGNDRNTMQLTGHIDGDSLKRWVRLSETKKGTNVIRPVFLLSSTIPGLTMSPGETSERIRNSPLAEGIFTQVNHQFQRLNAKLYAADRPAPLSNPPKDENDIYSLRDYGNQMGNSNTAVWVYLAPCASCGGARIDTFLYSLSSTRLVFALSEDLPLQPKDFSNPERIKAVLAPVFQQFHLEFESAVSEGKLLSSSFRIIVEGLESYRLYKLIENEMNRMDFISQPTLKQVVSHAAEFNVLSSLPSDELAQRIQSVDFNGYHLKPQRVDPRAIYVRYSK